MATEALVAHRTQVMRLYRHSLKAMMSWAVQREFIYEKGREIRSEFEANRNLPTIAEAQRLVEAGQERLRENAHPDPYIVPYYIGGSMYARNPPFPKEVHIQSNFGREGYEQ
mmetsp:Transcript_13286/g.33336  ORF Transcript_13286/g.33336 Transcript_13286/m.33336 type:complete len:112 (+) Transcript_13286:37-372(+)